MTSNKTGTTQNSQLSTDYYSPIKEIDLSKAFSLVWKGKWIILCITLLFAIGSVFYAKSLQNIYMAEAKLAPSEEMYGVSSDMMNQVGGLASLAGFQLGNQAMDKATLAMEIMQSRKFIGDFIESKAIKPKLFAVDTWNQDTGEITYDSDIYDVTGGLWVREVPLGKSSEPTLWESVERFRQLYTVQRSGPSGLVEVKIEHPSPVVAKTWVDWLVEDINNVMRTRDIAEATSSISYLEAELVKTRLASMEQGFYRLIEQQMQTMMGANTRPEYVFRVIDPAVVPEERLKPSRALIAIIGTILGGILGVFIALISQYIIEQKRVRRAQHS